VIVVLAAGVAHAQYNVPAQVSGGAHSLQIADRPAEPGPPPPTSIGWELGASLDFVTSDPSLGGRSLKFSDVVLFRAHGLVAIGPRLELFGGIDLLPKQPSYTDEAVWQGGLAGARYRFADAFAAFARATGGPELERAGWWGAGEAAAQYQRDLAEQTLFWESDLGGTYTRLFPHVAADRAWEAELLARTGLAVRDKKGAAACWLAFTFHFPLVSGGPIDPQTRVDVVLGLLLGVSKTLDLFAEYSLFDRGDLENPATTLPILSQGFDQKRLVFGFNRRFGDRKR